MNLKGAGNKLQILYKVVTYVLIIFGGTIAGALIGAVTGSINLHLSVDNMGTLGACLGACLAMAGGKFAIEHHEAVERNRELFCALEGRLARVMGPRDPARAGK
jgi:hypothetical protein